MSNMQNLSLSSSIPLTIFLSLLNVNVSPISHNAPKTRTSPPYSQPSDSHQLHSSLSDILLECGSEQKFNNRKEHLQKLNEIMY